jgi:hypothetical protein
VDDLQPDRRADRMAGIGVAMADDRIGRGVGDAGIDLFSEF